jgi:hypothetical protein
MKTIKNLEGVEILSKNEMRNVDGGGIRVRNIEGTGRLLQNGSMECTWEVRSTFLGIGYGEWSSVTGNCPEGHGGENFTSVQAPS